MLVAFICIPELWSILLKWISGVDEPGLYPALNPKSALLLPTGNHPPPVMKSKQGGVGGQPGQPFTSLWALDRITSSPVRRVRCTALTVMSCVPPPDAVFCSLMMSVATGGPPIGLGITNVWLGAKGSTAIAWPPKVTLATSVDPRTPSQVASDSASTNEAVT